MPLRPAPLVLPHRTGDARLLCALLAVLLLVASWRLVSAARRGPRAIEIRPHRVDVNHAPVSELGALPGVGPALASRIDAARRSAPFRRPDDLRRVPGIGPVAAARLLPHVRFDSGEPDP